MVRMDTTCDGHYTQDHDQEVDKKGNNIKVIPHVPATEEIL